MQSYLILQPVQSLINVVLQEAVGFIMNKGRRTVQKEIEWPIKCSEG